MFKHNQTNAIDVCAIVARTVAILQKAWVGMIVHLQREQT